MHNRTHHSLLLSFFACWLVLAGSGDDFNVLRGALGVPANSTSSGNLPLDDPNSDFVQPDTGDQATQLVKWACCAAAGLAQMAGGAPWPVRASETCCSPRQCVPPAKPSTPLRC